MRAGKKGGRCRETDGAIEARGRHETRVARRRENANDRVDGARSGTKQQKGYTEKESGRERAHKKKEGKGCGHGTRGSEAGRLEGRAAACLCLCFGK